MFNIEGESSQTANIVTYGTLTDMLGDTNRLGVFSPNPTGFGRNIVGSGAEILITPLRPPGTVPEPGTLLLLVASLGGYLVFPQLRGLARRMPQAG